MKPFKYSSLLILIIYTSCCYSQSLENLNGSYLVEQDGISNSYVFNKKQLVVKINLNHSFKEEYTYYYRINLNDDKSLYVYLKDIKVESIDKTDQKTNKPKSIATPNMTLGYFWCVWTLEKTENEKLFIKVDPPSPKWPSKNNWKNDYYSGFENNFVLIPISNQ